MQNTEESVVPYVTTAARLSFDALVAAYRRTQSNEVNFFLWDTFQLALKDPALRHDGTKDLQIKQLGRAYILDNAKERLFGGDDVGLDNLAMLLTDDDPERPKKAARCCRSDWLQAIIRGGIQVVQKNGGRTREFVEVWGAEFIRMAEQHPEGRGPLVNRFREVYRVICGTPDLIDLMGMLKRHKAPVTAAEGPTDISIDTSAEDEALSLMVSGFATEPETSPAAPVVETEDKTVTILENPYGWDWAAFKDDIQAWPRVFVTCQQVFFVARTYLDERHRRVYEGGHIFTHKNGSRSRQSIHELPLVMQVVEKGRLEMKYTVTVLRPEEAIGICGKFWKNTDGQGDEVSLYRWFVVTRHPHVHTVPVVSHVSQSQFNRFSEARLNDSLKSAV